MSPKALSASVSGIGSVVSMIDRIAGSAPGNGSRAAVGEDLVAMTKCRPQARNCAPHDGPNGTKKMRRYTSAMPLNVVSSVGSVNDVFKPLTGAETSDLESTATSSVKRPRVEVIIVFTHCMFYSNLTQNNSKSKHILKKICKYGASTYLNPAHLTVIDVYH